jgi:hypothetical protein
LAVPHDRQKTHDTARRFLAEGRLTIRQASHTNGVVAHVRGDSGLTYRAQWSPDLGWLRNCVTRTDQCTHLIALRLITDTKPQTPAKQQ